MKRVSVNQVSLFCAACLQISVYGVLSSVLVYVLVRYDSKRRLAIEMSEEMTIALQPNSSVQNLAAATPPMVFKLVQMFLDVKQDYMQFWESRQSRSRA